jgi:hypothetical protein
MLKRCCRRHAIPKWQGRSIRKNLKRGAAAAPISTEQDMAALLPELCSMPAADMPAAALRFVEPAPCGGSNCSDTFQDHFDGDYDDGSFAAGTLLHDDYFVE